MVNFAKSVALGLVVAAIATAGIACGDDESRSTGIAPPGTGGGGGSGGDTSGGGQGGQAPCATVTGEVVTLTTSDGVALEGDLHTTGVQQGPAAVLLHMIPPGNNRSNYPLEFITKLTAAGIAVLNLDRRGAGNSGGVAMDAYTGPNGKLDAEAAVAFLQAHECAHATDRLALIGASTALDYAVNAGTDAALPVPKALVFLTGGGYTENQNQVSDNRALLDTLAISFVYSGQESFWSASFTLSAPATWSFNEYNPGAHGTGIFAANPESMDDVVSFLSAAL